MEGICVIRSTPSSRRSRRALTVLAIVLGTAMVGGSTVTHAQEAPTESDVLSVAELAKFSHLGAGEPACLGTLLIKPYYISCHEDAWLIPTWVGYRLTADDLEGKAKRTDDFRSELALPADRRAEPSDYKKSGFDQGHMAPAADFVRSRKAMSDTFVLSNMAPQTAALNRDAWRRLEDQVRDLVLGHGVAWIFTGNVFLDAEERPTAVAQTIGSHKVAVPTHCFKVVLCVHENGTTEAFAFLMPNQETKIPGQARDYQRTVDAIEKLTDLDFFERLPDSEEAVLESAAAPWPID